MKEKLPIPIWKLMSLLGGAMGVASAVIGFFTDDKKLAETVAEEVAKQLSK